MTDITECAQCCAADGHNHGCPVPLRSSLIYEAFAKQFEHNPQANELTPLGFFEAGWNAALLGLADSFLTELADVPH